MAQQQEKSIPSNSKRIAKNSLMLYFRMILVMLVTLYTSRVVLEVLGIIDFGVYNVVGGFVAILAFFTSSLSNATQRFLSIELGRNDLRAANRVFSQSIILYVLFCIAILIVAFTIGFWFVSVKLNIPDSRRIAANIVYAFSVLSVICSIVQVPYMAVIISRERMSFYAYLGVFDVFFRLLMVFLLQITPNVDRLIYYAILMFGVYIVITLVYVVYCCRNFKECLFRWCWDKSLIRKMLRFISYNLFGCFAYSTGQQGVNIVMNLFFGPIVNAARGIAAQVNAAVLRFTDAIMTAIKPQIIKSYSTGEYNYMFSLMEYSSKLGCLCMMFLGLPIVFNAEYILMIWLKNVPDYTVIFVQILIFQSLFLVLINPLWMLANATGNIKRMQVWGRLFSLLALPVSYIVLRSGLSESPASAAIILMAADVVYWLYGLYDIKLQLDISIKRYFTKIVIPIAIILFFTCLMLNILVAYFSSGFLQLIVVTLSSALLLLLMSFYVGLSKDDRMMILRKIKMKTK